MLHSVLEHDKDSVDMNIKCDGMFITELIANLIQSQSLKNIEQLAKIQANV